jgi:hypothetical protein
MAGSRPFTGFGVGFRDFDHDGNLDLFVANGRVRLGVQERDPNDPYAEPSRLLRGLGGEEFAEVWPAVGVTAAGRGAAFGDLDNDGAEDVVVACKDGPVRVLRNLVGSGGNWIGLDVRAANGTVARNAVVRIDAGGRTQWRQVQPNEGYASSNDPRLVWGLGQAAAIERVVVRWPDGFQETFPAPAAGRYHELRRGTGTASPGAFTW